jgi:hypothetical protein
MSVLPLPLFMLPLPLFYRRLSSTAASDVMPLLCSGACTLLPIPRSPVSAASALLPLLYCLPQPCSYYSAVCIAAAPVCATPASLLPPPLM